MSKNQNKEKKWWQHLLIIPIMLTADVLALYAAGIADTASAGDGTGHPAPNAIIWVVLLCGVLTVVLTIRALILCIRTVIRTRRGNKPASAAQQAVGQDAVNTPNKPVWHCFIPLMIEIPLAIITVYVYGCYEINSFYNDPDHIGFAIPLVTFILAGLFLLVTVVLGVFCIIAAVKRNKRNR